MAIEIDESQVRYIENGEPHDEEVYNRALKDAISQANPILNRLNRQTSDDAIVYAIALG